MKKISLIILLMLTACSTDESYKKKQEKLDKEIKQLKHQSTQSRIKEMNLEIESQPLMFEEWAEFAKTLKAAEKEEKEVELIEKKIKVLHRQSDELKKSLLHE